MTYTIDRASWVSPNHESRDGQPVSLIVMHATVGNARPSLMWLCDPASGASTHYLINKAGDIWQLVAEDRGAWHAGVSSYRGLDSAAIRNRSIGIELENRNDGKDSFPAAQIDATVWLVKDIATRHKIPREMVTTHAAIAPGRKSDPRGLNMTALLDEVYMPDYAALWGTVAPYNPTWGIASAWRDHYRTLGAAVTGEIYPIAGSSFAIQVFAGGIITWSQFAGTRVFTEN